MSCLTILTALSVCSRIAAGRDPSTATATATATAFPAFPAFAVLAGVGATIPVIPSAAGARGRGTVAACMAALRL